MIYENGIGPQLRAMLDFQSGPSMREQYDSHTLSHWGIGPYRGNLLGEAIRRSGEVAAKNFRRIHGADPHPMSDIYGLIRDYAHIPTLEELAAKTADLSRRIDAAKEKHTTS